MTARRSLVAAFGAVLAPVVALLVARSWASGTDPAVVAGDSLVGCSFVWLALIAWVRWPANGTARLMLAFGIAWFGGTLVPGIEFAHRAFLLQLTAAAPEGRIGGSRRTAGRLAVGTAVAAIYVLTATRVGGTPIAGLTVGLLLVSVGAWRLVAASRWEVRVRIPVVLASWVAGGVLVVGSILRLLGEDAGLVGLFAYDAALMAVAVAALVALQARPWSEDVRTQLVVDLGDAALSGSVRDRVAHAIGDPGLRLGFALAGRPGTFVDERGRPIARETAIPGRVIRAMAIGDRATGFVDLHAALDDPRLVDAIARAAELARSSASLQAEIHARVEEVEQSRARLVATTDEQRRRIQSSLESRVGTRLDAVAGWLDDLARGTPALAGKVGSIRADLDRARVALDDLARGVHPAALETDGLRAALSDLVAGSPFIVELDISPERFPTVVESTLYFVTSEAIANAAKHARATRVAVGVRRSGAEVRLRVTDDGVGGAHAGSSGGLRGLKDRVEALGGSLSISTPRDGGTRLEATLPTSRPVERDPGHLVPGLMN